MNTKTQKRRFSNMAITEARPDGCDAILIQDTVQENSNFETKLVAVLSIDEESYEKLQNNAAGSVGLDVFDLFDFDLGGSYADFSERRKRYIEEKGISIDRRSALATMRRFTKPEQIQAWRDCKRWNARTNYGFRCWTESEDFQTVVVNFYWNPNPGEANIPAYLDVVVSGGQPVKPMNYPVKMPVGGIPPQQYRRNTNETFTLTASLSINQGGYQDQIQLPSAPLTIWPIYILEKSKGLVAVKSDQNCQYYSKEGPDSVHKFVLNVIGTESTDIGSLRIEGSGSIEGSEEFQLDGTESGEIHVELINDSRLVFSAKNASGMSKDSVLAQFWAPNPQECKDHDFEFKCTITAKAMS